MTVEQTSAWSPGPLAGTPAPGAVVTALLTEAAGAITEQGAATHAWTGAAAEEAAGRRAELGTRLADLQEALAPLHPAVARAADRLALLVATVRLADLAVLSGGSPFGPPLGSDPDSDPGSVAATQLAAAIDAELAAALEGILRACPGPSAPSAGRESRWTRTTPVGADAPLSVPLSTASAPDDVVTWWAALSAAGQQAAVTQRPEVVGPADGLPGWARDRANRILLDRAEAELTGQAADVQPGPQTWRDIVHGDPGLLGAMTIGTFGGGRRRIADQQAVAKLAAVRATRQVLALHDGPPRQLLTFDVSGRSAKVAVAVGDVDRAGHVAVVVPGFTTTVERDLVGSDRVAADLRRASLTEAALVGDRQDVAVVSWLGYDVPQAADTLRSSHSVALRDSAEAGAASLAGFLAGIPPDRHLTLVGHSYGSTTAGLAVARGNTGVDDLVVAGSPGVGVDSSDRLGLPARRVHVLEAHDDPVADLGWFGRDPSGLAGVDLLSTAGGQLPDGGAGLPSTGHSEYFLRGTTSQWNVAAVVAGAPSVPAGRPPVSW